MKIKCIHAYLAVACGLLISCARSAEYDRSEVVNETYVHRYGVEVPRDEWTESGRDGHIVSTLANGVTIDKCYMKGVLHGDISYTFPNSHVIERLETYDRNQLIKEISYSITSLPIQEIVYDHGKGKKITSWYEDGSPQSIEELNAKGLISSGEYYDAEHQQEGSVSEGKGIRFVRNATGELLSKDFIQDGEMVLSSVFYPNESLKESTSYQHGLIEGQRKTYFPGGEPNHVEEWKEGKKNGITAVFQNGAKWAEIPYVAGLKHGIEKHFSDDNSVVEEIAWEAGLKHGPAMSYLGQTTRTEWYYQGRPVTQSSYEFMTGHS